jgi:DNA-binding SARP family transcriptional activator
MRALYRAGRHVEALAVYRKARCRLDEELGLSAARWSATPSTSPCAALQNASACAGVEHALAA